METSRLETFSDGVFAIAATLLILDVSLPAGLEKDLCEETSDRRELEPGERAFVHGRDTPAEPRT